MVNAQADARPSKAGNIATVGAHYMNRMPGSAPATTTIQQPLNDAQMLAAWLLSIKGAHNRMSTEVVGLPLWKYTRKDAVLSRLWLIRNQKAIRRML